MVIPIQTWGAGTLTGKKRVRKGWFGKIILQVEVEQTRLQPPHEMRRCDSMFITRKVWRDATAADVGLETTVLDFNPT